MPDYSRLRDLISHRVILEYDTGVRLVGYVSGCRPNSGPVTLLNLSRVEFQDPKGEVLETSDTLTVCPNLLTGFRLEEGPSGRTL